MPIYNQTRISEQALVVTAGAYSAGDVVGGLLTFDLSSPGGGGVLKQVILLDDANQKAALKLYLFNSAPTDFADNAAYAPTFADLKKRVGDVIAIATADYVTVNSNAEAVISALNAEYALAANGKLYGYLVCDATPTYAATTDLYIRLLVWQD